MGLQRCDNWLGREGTCPAHVDTGDAPEQSHVAAPAKLRHVGGHQR